MGSNHSVQPIIPDLPTYHIFAFYKTQESPLTNIQIVNQCVALGRLSCVNDVYDLQFEYKEMEYSYISYKSYGISSFENALQYFNKYIIAYKLTNYLSLDTIKNDNFITCSVSEFMKISKINHQIFKEDFEKITSLRDFKSVVSEIMKTL